MSVDIESLEVGRCYRIRSRNLRLAVWDGDAFIGIRHKFDARFLDSEYANHTVTQTEPLDARVPEGMSLQIHLGSRCLVCGTEARWLGPPAPAPWRCEGPCADEEVRSVAVRNADLFAFLESLEAQEGTAV